MEGTRKKVSLAFAFRRLILGRVERKERGRERERERESSHFFLLDVVHVAPLKADGGLVSNSSEGGHVFSKLTFSRARVSGKKVRGEEDESRMINTWCKNRSDV